MPTLKTIVAPMLGLFISLSASASDLTRVDADIKAYDDRVFALNSAFAQLPENSKDKGWAKSKLSHMVEVDQYMRRFSSTPFDQRYTDAEKQEFQIQFVPRWMSLDGTNTHDLRGLLKLYPWFSVSEFGTQADQDAWLLVQHADQDSALQKEVLTILSALYPKGESKPANYAYLFDRVAASFQDPSQRKPQRYGTQGTCTGPATWQPLPVEDPAHLDLRRNEVGLGTEAAYMAIFKDICR